MASTSTSAPGVGSPDYSIFLDQYNEKDHPILLEALGWIKTHHEEGFCEVNRTLLEKAIDVISSPKAVVKEVAEIALFFSLHFPPPSGDEMSVRSSPGSVSSIMSSSASTGSLMSESSFTPPATRFSVEDDKERLFAAVSSDFVVTNGVEEGSVAEKDLIYAALLERCGGDAVVAHAVIEEVSLGPKLLNLTTEVEALFKYAASERFPVPTGRLPTVELGLTPDGVRVSHRCEFHLKDLSGGPSSEPFNVVYETDPATELSRTYLDKSEVELYPADRNDLAQTTAQVTKDLERDLTVTINGEAFRAGDGVAEAMYAKILELVHGDETKALAYFKYCHQGATGENTGNTFMQWNAFAIEPPVQAVQKAGHPYTLELTIREDGSLLFKSIAHYSIAEATAERREHLALTAIHAVDTQDGSSTMVWQPLSVAK